MLSLIAITFLLVPVKVQRDIVCAFTPDGQEEHKDIYRISPDGLTRTRLTQMPGSEDQPQWSPDGQSVAFASRHLTELEVYVVQADGSHLRNLSQHPQWDSSPSWSPDGRQIVFASTRDGGWKLVVARVSDGLLQTLPCPFPGGCTSPQWSPNGQRIAFVAAKTNEATEIVPYAIGVCRPDGSDSKLLATLDNGDRSFSWSPDGPSLAYVARDHQVHVLDAASGEDRTLTQGPAKETPAWSPDGSAIAFSQEGRIGLVMLKDQSIRLLDTPVAIAPIWSPDSKTLLAQWQDQGLGLLRIDVASGKSIALTTGPGLHLQPDWGP